MPDAPKVSPVRIWLKVKVMMSPETQEVQAILQTWARLRSTPKHLTRAIRLYQAILTGDMSSFWQLMREFFPGFVLAIQFNTGSGAAAFMPSAKLQITTDKRSAAELLDAADPFGLDDLVER